MRVENVGLRKVNVRSNVLQSLQTFELEYIDCVMLDLTAVSSTLLTVEAPLAASSL